MDKFWEYRSALLNVCMMLMWLSYMVTTLWRRRSSTGNRNETKTWPTFSASVEITPGKPTCLEYASSYSRTTSLQPNLLRIFSPGDKCGDVKDEARVDEARLVFISAQDEAYSPLA